MATVQINGQLVEAEVGEMLIAATDRAGVYIPRFCYHEKLSIAANCRMCLVEVGHAPEPLPAVADGERKTYARDELRLAPKPLPACATPVSDNMVVFTRSQLAREAQQGTLEFLLINHPLDCPVCDQGGECPLQDQAMGYGSDDSRYLERKRSVASHDLGPLIATEMTRCIHCTRCVRFGEEVAGLMELGMPGRGEHAYIGTFLNRAVDSEVSGNMIDLCPVGALTSKPYRFAARSWELENHRGISPHDCVGANLTIQTLRGRVERVLPYENPRVNECWLADRDRYSYEAVNSERRLGAPMVKTQGEWKEVAWEDALQRACDGIKAALQAGGGDHLGALAGYASTLEEYFLLQKLVRALGGNHIDHRLQQSDFRDDAVAPVFPASEMPIEQFDRLRAALLVGSNIRKEQPLLALRLRAATRENGARISSINPLAYAQNFEVQTAITAGADMVAHLAAVASDIAAASPDVVLPDGIEQWLKAPTTAAVQPQPGIARSLLEAGADGAVIIGAPAQQHGDAGVIKAIAQWICETTGAHLAVLPPGNSAAAWWAGCLPHRGPGGVALSDTDAGLNAAAMLAQPRRAYLLLATDPELDAIDGRAAFEAMKRAEFVVQISAYRSDAAMECADVLLPMAAFTESAGHFLNCEGRVQRAEVAAKPLGESRPAWKILRVLGNFLDLPGFDYVSLEAVNADIPHHAHAHAHDGGASARMREWSIPAPRIAPTDTEPTGGDNSLLRLPDLPMYRGDQTVRHAPALQKTADNPPPAAHLNRATIDRLGLAAGDQVKVQNGAGSASLPLRADERVPGDCVYVPAGYAQTARLGGHGRVTLEKIR